jgi:preprotein translocase subunit SecA
MTTGFLQKFFGSRNQRLVKQYQKTVAAINAFEPTIEQYTDKQLRAKTDEFRQRVASGESLDRLLPEAFAVCREASKRVLKMRHFDVQLIGGMVLHYGKIAEMRTGEGKTLVATLAAYLNALSGRGVHVVTVNDYLAQRDAEWMGKLYNFLGLSWGINLSQMEHAQKQEAYAADITYGTNNEFGFDYLRDNMVYETDARVQRPLNFAVVDEVDSILIDEARTPLIISGQAEDHTELYVRMNALPPLLEQQIGEEKGGRHGCRESAGRLHAGRKSASGFPHRTRSRKGRAPAGRVGSDRRRRKPLRAAKHHADAPCVRRVARAHAVFPRPALRGARKRSRDRRRVHRPPDDRPALVRRPASGRGSEGTRQDPEREPDACVDHVPELISACTAKLSGMTGTADTEAYEFNEIYGLETVVIPTNRPPKRIDKQDQIYKTAKERYDAVIARYSRMFERGQPVLVGTTSIESSELLSGLLDAGKSAARSVEREAARARSGDCRRSRAGPAVTIATNMAGRGTDIVLGGNVEKQPSFIEADESLSDEEKQRRIKHLQDEWQALHDR